MKDVIIGMGEVGTTIYDLLTERNYDCVGIDIDESRSKNYSKENVNDIEFLHICLPGELENFEGRVLEWIQKINCNAVVIHSTIVPGTTKRIQNKAEIPIVYSPVRGVHRRFLEDMKRYTKFFSCDIKINDQMKNDLEKRFEKIQWMTNSKTAEFAKILVDTTYYGWLINYAQITKMICDKEEVDFDEMWGFSDEIHQFLGNRPKMFPGIIGGHCVIPNLGLLNDKDLINIKKINDLYRNYSENQ